MQTDCCVVGGGPAGAVLALLLARQAIDVTLLEAHQDFDRDFRGDTVHPSTLVLLEQLGLLERLFELPHARLTDFPVHYPDGSISPTHRRRRSARHPYSYDVPQARFIDLLVTEARTYPSFHLEMGARVEQLVQADGIVKGVRYRAADGWHEVRATLVVGADGRFSKIRQLADMRLVDTVETIDVLWLRLPRCAADPERAQGIYVNATGRLVVADTGDAWRIGYVFAKGGYQRLRAAGLEALRQSIADRAPWLSDRLNELHSWQQTSLLAVQVGRVRRWYRPGLLLIGDAAHVMSPVAGVGINYAIQDAIVASNVLGPRLRQGTLRLSDLAKVQRRRELPTRLMQFMQRQMQRRLDLQPHDGPDRGAWIPRLIDLPLLADLRGRLINFGGLRPERVRDVAPKVCTS